MAKVNFRGFQGHLVAVFSPFLGLLGPFLAVWQWSLTIWRGSAPLKIRRSFLDPRWRWVGQGGGGQFAAEQYIAVGQDDRAFVVGKVVQRGTEGFQQRGKVAEQPERRIAGFVGEGFELLFEGFKQRVGRILGGGGDGGDQRGEEDEAAHIGHMGAQGLGRKGWEYRVLIRGVTAFTGGVDGDWLKYQVTAADNAIVGALRDCGVVFL